jgi:Leucine-rich repeat (LRR) protein
MKTQANLVLLTFCIFFFVSFNAFGQSEGNVPDATEYQALKDLFLNCNGASWNNKTNWPTNWGAPVNNAQFGLWYGVSVVNGDVTYLNLGSNNLSGPIPESIGQLVKLKGINLENNHLTGNIPETMGNLSQLSSIYFNLNQLTGSVPSFFGNLSLLTRIWLNNNLLSGNIPSLTNVSSLVELNLGNNQLSGSLPSNFFSNFGHMELLRLADNNLSGPLPDMSVMSSLQTLDLMNNQLTGGLPQGLVNASDLRVLQLGNNLFTGQIPESYGTLSNLTSLSLSNNQLSGSIPNSLGNLTKLIFVFLADNKLSGDIPASFSNLVLLNRLHLYNNQLSGSIGFISPLNNLEEAYLYNNLFSEAPFSNGINKPHLNLQLQRNNLTFTQIVSLLTSGYQYLFISPQNLIDVEKTINGVIGSPLTLTSSIDRSTNPSSTYQWFKKINGITTALNTSSVTGHTLTLPNIATSDNGAQYYYTIANSTMPGGFTLTSRIQTLNAVICNVPAIEFQFAQEDNKHTFTPSIMQADGCAVTYNWDFGDGEVSTDQVASHTYNTTGTYVAKLTLNYTCGSCPASTLVKEYPVEITNTNICNSIYCDGLGGVGIGTRKTEGFRLSVEGKIRASEIIKVYPKGQWSDFVFAKNYRLRPLSEVEDFIKINGHLPEIPSAAEVEKEGVELGSMDAKLLQKIEELTMYMIEMKKINAAIQKDNIELKTENKHLNKKIDLLSQQMKSLIKSK